MHKYLPYTNPPHEPKYRYFVEDCIMFFMSCDFEFFFCSFCACCRREQRDEEKEEEIQHHIKLHVCSLPCTCRTWRCRISNQRDICFCQCKHFYFMYGEWVCCMFVFGCCSSATLYRYAHIKVCACMRLCVYV